MSTPTPLLDFFKRGEVAQDVRLLAAEGGLAPRAAEQLAILIFLLDDKDADVRLAADATLGRIPVPTLQAFLGRPDVSVGVREFFADRGVFPAETPDLKDAIDRDDPIIEAQSTDALAEGGDADKKVEGEKDGEKEDDVQSVSSRIAAMSFTQRLKAAMKGSREVRSILIRDPNKMIAAAVLSSPKVSEQDVESYARMASVTEDVLRIIGSNRSWMKNYGIVTGLARNPKTPLALSLRLLTRLNDRDAQMLSMDRNVNGTLRIAARKRSLDGGKT